MNDKNIFLLLRIIKSNGNINRLRREGLSYHDIAILTSHTISEGLVVYDEGENISLSSIGLKKFKEFDSGLKKKKKEEWIEPENKSKVAPIDKYFIFVPLQNELDF